jgi:aromatic ring-opening dioxygenase LigB subunit
MLGRGIILWSLGLLVPHAPILVPLVASISGSNCGNTSGVFRSLGRTLSGIKPDFLLLLNPHSLSKGVFSLLQARSFSGNLSEFGTPSVSFNAMGAGEEGKALALHLNANMQVNAHLEDNVLLDYASVVSLYFLRQAIGYIPPMVMANPLSLSYRDAFDLGRHLRSFTSRSNWALLASGDLSHCLNKSAPGGFHPDGEILDRAVIQSLEQSSPLPVFSLRPDTIRNAGECGLRSVLALIGLSGGKGIELLAYEAPYGVGYASAAWRGNDCP